MTIVFVIDMYDSTNNGTTMTAYRFVEHLRRRGHTVRIVSTGEPDHDKYVVPELKIPIASFYAHKQNFAFAKPVEPLLRQAFSGADIVHLMLPLRLERHAARICHEMKIPCSAAFHLQPENVTYSIHLKRFRSLSAFCYRFMYRHFYHQFSHIHCPSTFIADQLKQNGYQSKLHVISNGVSEEFVPPSGVFGSTDGLFRIVMIGRYALEKRQDVLIRAIGLSKYSDRIQLYLAGHGPLKHHLTYLGRKLKYPPVFGFYEKSDLIALIHSCDLYVHASDIEIEAISCIEAFSCGLVPIISNSDRSATPQFAIDKRSLFAAGDPYALAQKIDYWLDHPEERSKMSAEYVKLAEQYRISNSIQKIEEMFCETIQDFQKKETRH